MPAPMPKHTIKLRQPDQQGREFIKVSSNNKTSWVSCTFQEPFKNPYRNAFRMPQVGFTLSQRETNLLFGGTVFILGAVAFLPSALAVETGEVVLVSIYSTAGEFIGFRYVALSAIRGAAMQIPRLAAFLGTAIPGSAWLFEIMADTPNGASFNGPCIKGDTDNSTSVPNIHRKPGSRY